MTRRRRLRLLDGLVAGDDDAMSIHEDRTARSVCSEGVGERLAATRGPSIRIVGIARQVR